MKTFLIIISTLLLVALVVVGIIIFGPFRDLLPQETRTAVDTNIPDYFRANARPPVTSGGSDVPFGGSDSGTRPGVGTTTPATTWTLPGVVAGTTVVVQQFVQSTSTALGPNDLPTGNVQLVPTNTSTPYLILYFGHDQSFMISLVKEPLKESRKSAETMFLRLLGITETEACSLRYAVGVPSALNSFYAGKNLGFSFCPGSTPL
jgi:hypothetical protein